MAPAMRVIIYSRCSTDERRQDTEIQLKELRQYVQAHGWDFDEVGEYGSGFKGEQPKLREIVEKIRRRHYQILIVHSLDRFSRTHPRKTNELLDSIVFDYKCRFISIREGIDSDNELSWNILKPLLAYFANLFSKNLSEKIKLGIRNKKEKGLFRGGRPRKEVDLERLRSILSADGRLPLRELETRYNTGVPKAERLSYATIRKALPLL